MKVNRQNEYNENYDVTQHHISQLTAEITNQRARLANIDSMYKELQTRTSALTHLSVPLVEEESAEKTLEFLNMLRTTKIALNVLTDTISKAKKHASRITSLEHCSKSKE